MSIRCVLFLFCTPPRLQLIVVTKERKRKTAVPINVRGCIVSAVIYCRRRHLIDFIAFFSKVFLMFILTLITNDKSLFLPEMIILFYVI